jgi:kumamolisin
LSLPKNSQGAAARGLPDVAGADPETGYEVRVDGLNMVIGGTSAVPLWSGLLARVNRQPRSPLASYILYCTRLFPRASTTSPLEVTVPQDNRIRLGPVTTCARDLEPPMAPQSPEFCWALGAVRRL